MVQRFHLVTLLLTAAVGAVSCSPQPTTKGTDRDSINISINSWVGWGPLFIAKEKGFFGDTKVNLQFVEDAGNRRLGMIAGKVDGYASSIDNLAIDATYGVRGKTVLCFDESVGADGIVARSNITWNNFKGRTVAVQQGLPGHFLLLTALHQHKLKPTDVNILDMDADKAGNAFVAGSIDVAVTWEPWISKAAAMAGGKKLVTTADMPGTIVDTLVLRDPVVQQKPQAIVGIARGWFRALQWYSAHPAEGDAIIGRAYNLPPADVRAIVRGIRFYDQPRNRACLGGSEGSGHFLDVFSSASNLWKDAGVTHTTMPAAEYVDSRFVQ